MHELLLSTCDDATQRVVGQVLESESRGSSRLRCVRDLGELEVSLSRHPASLALVDVNGSTPESLGRFEPLIRRTKQTAFVFVCDELRVDLVLKAMQIGARHCLMRGTIVAELPALLARLTEEGHGASPGAGRVITVLGAGGGCGATTLAINLAEELRLLDGDKGGNEAGDEGGGEALLVDLDRFTGAMATYMGVECEYGIADVLGSRRTIDPDLIRSTATPCGQGLQLLASPASIDFGGRTELPLENLERVLAACSAAFPWTVIDAARVGVDAAAQLAQASTLALVVFQLSVVDVRITRSLVTALIDRGVARELIWPIANRFHKRHALVSFDDASQALDGLEPGRIPNDFASAIRALDLGQPLARVAPRSPLRKSIRDLAGRIDSLERAAAPSNG